MKVEEIMTIDPAYATLDMSLHDVAKIMAEKDCGCVPVIETKDDKTPIGMITDRDITIRTIAHNKNPLNMIAGEVMTNDVVSVMPDTTVEECCTLMEKNQIRRVAVVDSKGDLVGIVAQADIARLAPAAKTAELVKDVSLVRKGATA